ncbi:hypothetical protein MSG28_001570 [Choristoneura fumiferana]|uniref:Uncharacterized protein n=1 Tax=Choristoneura fumiferana TaxID=7141 RepID=A0ACC0KV59_CHOFU|nr:hypothetical protein MSG28_001570 [Choristoneura fumiferana]
MGKHFGELAFIRGIVYYKLSPHEQKPFAGAFTHGLFNIFPRTTATILYWLPPFLLGYCWYSAVESAYHHNKRKNLQDYANEVDPNPEPPPPEEPVKEGKKKC